MSISDLPDFPFVDDDAKTWQRLEPVRFFGERVPPFPADRPLPKRPVSQSDISTVVAGRACTPLACSTQNATTAREPGAVLAMGGGGCSLAEVRR